MTIQNLSRMAVGACAVLCASAQVPSPASEDCHGLGIDVEVACATANNVKSEEPAWLTAADACPAACGTAWEALLATCPVGTADWDLDGNTGSDYSATDWVDLQPGLAANKMGDAHSIVARVTLKWLELGVSKTLCPFEDGTEDAGTSCGTAQRIAQYSATSSTVMDCGNVCSAACQDLDDAAFAVGSGACCPAPATTAAECEMCSPAHCVSRSFGTGNELDYPGMVAVYAASSDCKVFECTVENLAGAFCGQTQHGTFGPLLCGSTGTLGFVAGLSGLLANTAIPDDMLSCVETLGEAPDTTYIKVSEMCAESSTPCPTQGEEQEQDDDDDDVPPPKVTSGAEVLAPAVFAAVSAIVLPQW